MELKGGERFKAQLRQLATNLQTARGVRIGFLEGATYPATPGKSSLNVATVAFWNEFGTSRAPARPFFRGMIRRQQEGWGAQLARFLRSTKLDAAKALSLLGLTIKEELTDSIATWPADNAPSTVRRKGFNHGLVDKGVMQRSTDFEVVR